MKATMYLNYIFLGLIISSPCFSSEELELRYMGYIFQVPAQPILVASSGDASNFLNFIYEKGAAWNKYLSIGNLSDDALVQSLESQENCSYRMFLSDVFHQTRNSGCSHEELDDFYKGLLHGNEYEVWPSKELDIYYTVVDETTYVLIAGKGGGVDVNIVTNFLNKEELKEVVSNYIQ